MSRPRRWRILAAGGVAAAAVTALVLAAPTPAGAVPAPPAGYTLVFGDDFNGAAGTGLNAANWLYDLGTGYPGGAANWGTGEVETMTSALGQRLPGRRRPPGDQADPGRRRQLDLGPDRDPAHRLRRRRPAARCGSRRRSSSRTSPAPRPRATGRRSGRWAPRPGRSARPTGRASARSTSWRTSTGSAPCSAPSTVDRPSGHRATRPPASAAASVACAGCQTGFHTYARGVRPQRVTRRQLRWYLDGADYFTLNRNQVDAGDLEQRAHHGFFMILNVAMGGGFPAAFGGGPTASTRPGVPMLVDYVAVYSAGGGTQPPPPPPGTGAYGTLQAESFSAQSGTQLEATTDAGGGQDMGFIANGDWACVRQRRLRQHRRAPVQCQGRLGCGRRGQRPGRGAAGQPGQPADRQLRDRQHGRLAELAHGPGERQRGHRRAHGLPDLQQRPAGRLRQRQLVHVRALTA